MTEAIERSLRFPEARVHVRAFGEGPPLLLINGLGGHTAMWEPLERVLEGFRIVEFDLPGAGRSDVPWRPVSIRRLARLAASVMTKFGMDRADILGYSMGGAVAQQLAADHPERVRRVVLAATTPGQGAVQGSTKAMLNIMTPARYMSAEAYTRTIASLVGGRARHDQLWIAEQTELRFSQAPPWRGYLAQLASMAAWSGLPLMPTIEAPTLVLTGDDDPLTPVVNAMLITHLLPNGRMRVFPGEGHLMMMDDQSGSHAVIKQFLTAENLKRSAVWKQSSTVSAAELAADLSRAGFQLPPWSIINAVARRRWLSLNGHAA